jgi:hypothetical protein
MLVVLPNIHYNDARILGFFIAVSGFVLLHLSSFAVELCSVSGIVCWLGRFSARLQSACDVYRGSDPVLRNQESPLDSSRCPLAGTLNRGEFFRFVTLQPCLVDQFLRLTKKLLHDDAAKR